MNRGQSKDTRAETMLSKDTRAMLSSKVAVPPCCKSVHQPECVLHSTADTRTAWSDQHCTMPPGTSTLEQLLKGGTTPALPAAALQCTASYPQHQLQPSCSERQTVECVYAQNSTSANSSPKSSSGMQQKPRELTADGCAPVTGCSIVLPRDMQHVTQLAPEQQQPQQQASTASYSYNATAVGETNNYTSTTSQQSNPQWQAEQLQLKDQLLACLRDENQQLVDRLMQVRAEVQAANMDMKNALKAVQGQLQELHQCRSQQQQQQKQRKDLPADFIKVDVGVTTVSTDEVTVQDAAGMAAAGIVGAIPSSAVDTAIAAAAAAAALAVMRVAASETPATVLHGRPAAEPADSMPLAQHRLGAAGAAVCSPHASVSTSAVAPAEACSSAGAAPAGTAERNTSLPADGFAVVVPAFGVETPGTGSSMPQLQQQQTAELRYTKAATNDAAADSIVAAPASDVLVAASSMAENVILCSACEALEPDAGSSTDFTEHSQSSFADGCSSGSRETGPSAQALQHRTDCGKPAALPEQAGTWATFGSQLPPLQLPQSAAASASQQSQLPLPCTPLVTPRGSVAALSSSSWVHRSPAPPPKQDADGLAAAARRPPRRHRSYNCVQQFKGAAAEAGFLAAGATATAPVAATTVRPGRQRPTGRLLDFDSVNVAGATFPVGPKHLQTPDPLHQATCEGSNVGSVICGNCTKSCTGTGVTPEWCGAFSMPRSYSQSQICCLDTVVPTAAELILQDHHQQQQGSKSPSPVHQPIPPGQAPTYGTNVALLSPKLACPHVRIACPPNSPLLRGTPSATTAGVVCTRARETAAARAAAGVGASGRCNLGGRFLPAPPSDGCGAGDIRFVAHRRRSCSLLTGLPGEQYILDVGRTSNSGHRTARNRTADADGVPLLNSQDCLQSYSSRKAWCSLDGGALTAEDRNGMLLPSTNDGGGGGAAAFAAAFAAVAGKRQHEQL